MNRLYCVTSLICVLGTLGCSSESTTSNVVKTEGIWADIRLTANGERSRVVAEFNLNSSTGANIILTGDDKVQATVGNESKTLGKDVDLFDIDYQGYFNQVAEGTEFKLELHRENESLTSITSLPPEVMLLSPVSSYYKKDERVLVEWKPESEADTTLTLNFTTTCKTNTGGTSTFGQSAELDDSQGQYYVLLGSIEELNDDTLDKSKPCSSLVTLSRVRKGTVDSKFKSGSAIYAIQTKKSEEFIITLN